MELFIKSVRRSPTSLEYGLILKVISIMLERAYVPNQERLQVPGLCEIPLDEMRWVLAIIISNVENKKDFRGRPIQTSILFPRESEK